METLVFEHPQLGNLIQHYYEIVALYQQHPCWTMGLHDITPIQYFELMYHVQWNHVNHIIHAPAIATDVINTMFCLNNHPFWETYPHIIRHNWWKETTEYRLKQIFNLTMMYDVDNNQEGLLQLQNNFSTIMHHFRMIDPLVDHYLHNDIPFWQWVQWLEGLTTPFGMYHQRNFPHFPYYIYPPTYYRCYPPGR